ncbi:GNAT family N-acetyltransferase [Agromyces sp. SYSU T00194]|uniref:GNAT family N-acetyltransferase n=1 Tax=Agromyces chitinivorans TaxID=3158560 RepID=UPI00339B0235
MTTDPRVAAIRAFNRTATERLGVLEEQYLSRGRPLGQDRILWEIGTDGADVRELRARLALDSGYLSRQLRALEDEGLIAVEASEADARVRRAHLTDAGTAEVGVLDRRSDELVGDILAPLSERQRDALADAADTVRRLFTASAVAIAAVDPAEPAARAAVAAYHRTLDARFDGGFRPARSRPAADDAFRAPRGAFLLATHGDRPVGCVGVTLPEPGVAELRRMWVADDLRGAGIGRRLLAEAERLATDAGARSIRLETNASLAEAIGLYRASGFREVPPFNDEPYAHHWFEKRLAGARAPTPRVGFIGLGIMGRPMATRLAEAGIPLTTWTRTPTDAPEPAGADVRHAASVTEVFATCETVFVMLRDAAAVDAVLRGAPGGLAALVAGRTIVHTGTVAPGYSRALADEVEQAGGCNVEAPVSGSRVPAERGELVAMVAGRPGDVRRVRPLLDPLCAQVTDCGAVPAGIEMKLAANVLVVAVMTGLAEAFGFARARGLDVGRLREILDAGQMSSPISRVKTAKLVAGDLTPQVSIADVLANTELIVGAARAAGLPVPLTEASRALFAAAVARGDGALDGIGVMRPAGAAPPS